MFLSKWKNHLALKNENNSLWEISSDYLSFPNLVDMLGLNSDNFYNFSHVINEFRYIYSDSIILDMDMRANYAVYQDLQRSINTDFFNFINLESLVDLSTVKNDVDELVKIFPSMEDNIEVLDLWTRFGEECLQEVESTPDVKLYYPEPFIASPSFVHEELWFIHILHYQHWLWFMFISLIMFYFITFINVVRWCNLRNKPKRETRGVSRSKCADLITATVPVSWAASIIISESVDATDYYDGFGTGEIVIGIRAYQWGWEYFYPKSIDLNYNVKPSYSTLVGNSIKYNNSSAQNSDANSFWKSYQGKSLQNLSVSPAHLVISPSDNSGLVNLSDFSKVGLSSMQDSSAFKKIQYHSKSPSTSLFDSSTSGYSKFGVLSSLYNNNSKLINSKDYYTDRQDSYSALLSTQANLSSSLESSSVNKYLDYNFGLSAGQKPSSFALGNSYSKGSEYFSDLSNSNRLSSQLVNSDAGTSNLPMLPSSGNNTSNINSTTDGKHFSNPLKFSLSSSNSRKASLNLPAADHLDLTTQVNSFESSAVFSNNEVSSKFKDLKSPNLGFLSPDKNARLVSKLHADKGQFNFSDSNNNLADILSSAGSSEAALYNSSSSDWVSGSAISKLSSMNVATSSTNSPIYSNDPNWVDKSYNKFENLKEEVAPRVMKSKEETAPSHLFSEYWETTWSNTNSSNRLKNNIMLNSFSSNFYLPAINEYAEYDFKNWQALESLEDCFWETTFSSFVQDEYLSALNNYADSSLLKRQEELYSSTNREHKFKNSKLYKSVKGDDSASSLSLFSKEGFINSPLLAKSNFIAPYNEYSGDSVEDSYDSLKSSLFNIYSKNGFVSSNSTYAIAPFSYTRVLDPFRADYEDSLWNFDSNDNAFSSNQEDFSSSRVSNPMRLRSTTRNAIVSYNAMQKVFKSRLDEGRSHARLADFSNSFTQHNFITAPKASYEGILSKNKNSFFDTKLYVASEAANFNLMSSVYNSLNSTLLDIPFLISAKSDPSRYLWFDWQARWSSIEVQPASSARYSLSGVPYHSKPLEFDTQAGDTLNESENYLNRLARVRKNYLANWAYSPFFYSRTSAWKGELLPSQSGSSVSSMKSMLLSSKSFWTDVNMKGSLLQTYNPSTSGTNTPTRSSWRPLSGPQGLAYDLSTFVDIVSKREHLYRTYLNSLNLVANLPSHMTSSPVNPVLAEINNGYGYVDPTSFSSELTREVLYTDLNFVKLNLLVNLFKNFTSTTDYVGLNTSAVNNYLFKYLLGEDSSNALGNNQSLLKNQYRPMKKGVTNMIRLQATGAIAMPIEIRLHILASSRDVIHSWAIPSAGIKIDCVPGYSSHRVTIFLVSGIFWGQCMEICGRFHHWMPIIVYFMKRDMFFLWCTHFMHYSTDLDIFDMTDRQLSDKLKVASFDKTSWVSEINKVV